MKILFRSFEKDKSGIVKLVAEDSEDIWTCYNLILSGDQVETSTYRRVQTESASGKMENSRVKLTLKISVETCEVDLTASTIRLKGRNMTESQHIKLGAYHSLEIGINQHFKLFKDEWSIIDLGILKSASDSVQKAEIAALLITEGTASVCLITGSSTLVMQNIETNIPKKRRNFPSVIYEKNLAKFYQHAITALLTNVNFDKIKVVIVAGPGFAPESFLKRLFQSDTATLFSSNLDITAKLTSAVKNRSKFVLAHCSAANKNALQEVFSNATIVSRIADTKFAKESNILVEFFKMLSHDSSKAFYGYGHVKEACDQGAVADLLLVDSLFRSVDFQERKKYISLVEDVRKSGGKVHIFSSAHPTGERNILLVFLSF